MAKTLEEIIDSLYGDTETMTKAELTAAVNSSGMKIADLSDGDFVTKQKYDDHVAKTKKLQADYDALKANPSESEQYKALLADRDDWKGKYETQNAELTRSRQKDYLSSQKVRPEFSDFLLSEINKNVSDTVDFETAAKKYIADHSQYIEQEPANPSGFRLGGDNNKKADIFADVEELIRS